MPVDITFRSLLNNFHQTRTIFVVDQSTFTNNRVDERLKLLHIFLLPHVRSALVPFYTTNQRDIWMEEMKLRAMIYRRSIALLPFQYNDLIVRGQFNHTINSL